MDKYMEIGLSKYFIEVNKMKIGEVYTKYNMKNQVICIITINQFLQIVDLEKI